MKQIIFVATAFFMMSTSLAIADALSIEPGLWKFTSTNTNPVTGQQESETETECVTEDTYDPLQELDVDEMDCEPVESNLDGNTLTFSMSCSAPGGQMTMTAVIQSDGDSIEGTTVAEMTFGGQTMNAESSFVGKRIGDCP